jgi:hypothetical protein
VAKVQVGSAKRSRSNVEKGCRKTDEAKRSELYETGRPLFGVSAPVTTGVAAEKIVAVSTKVIDDTIARATEVLGGRDEAYCWLGTPIRGLDFATPIYVLRTKGGAGRIKDILGQIENGTW